MKKRFNLKVLVSLTFVAGIFIGVLVLPEPQEARADNTTFKAVIYWEDVDVPDPDAVTMRVYTFDSNWLDVEDYDLSYSYSIGDFSFYEGTVAGPLDPDGVNWGVSIIDAAGYNVNTSHIYDGDGTIFGGLNSLDDQFVFSD